jgi:hypothetical protein
VILRSFIPPEHERDIAHLDAALAVAAGSPMRVQRADAVTWLGEALSRPVDPDVRTIVWHSLLWLYLPARDRMAIEATLAAAARPVARIAYEPHRWGTQAKMQVTAYW